MCTHLETESSTGNDTGKRLDQSMDIPAKCWCTVYTLEPLVLLRAMKTVASENCLPTVTFGLKYCVKP